MNPVLALAAHVALAGALTGSPATPKADECDGKLNDLLASKRYHDAAAVGERCWRETHDARPLAIAIQARIRLGHGAHAALALRDYSATPGANPENARFYADNISPLVVTIELDIGDLPPEQVQIRAVFLDQPAGTRPRGAILVDYASLRAADMQGRELALDRGRWNIEVLVSGASLSKHEINTREGLQLKLSPPTHPPPVEEERPTPAPSPTPDDTPRLEPAERIRRGVAIGVGIPALSAIATGATLLARRPAVSTGSPMATAESSLDRAKILWNGSVLVGAGIGGTAVVLSELARAPDTAYYAEVGAGGALGLAGLIWSAVHMTSYGRDTQARFDAGETTLPPSYFDSHFRKEVASGLILGLGTGLATGAAVSLVTRAIVKRRQRQGVDRTAWRRR